MASAAYERRNARARAAGFRNYYDQRVRGGVREARPDTPRPTGQALARARGHTGYADARRLLQSGRVELSMMVVEQRNPDGSPQRVRLTLMLDDGSDREFVLRGKALQPSSIDAMVGDFQAAGIARLSYYTIRSLRGTEEDEDLERQADDYREMIEEMASELGVSFDEAEALYAEQAAAEHEAEQRSLDDDIPF